MPSLTYAELAEALKITPASANKLAKAIAAFATLADKLDALATPRPWWRRPWWR